MCRTNILSRPPPAYPLRRSLREKLKLDPDAGVSTKYMLASLESDPQRLTKEDQVQRLVALPSFSNWRVPSRLVAQLVVLLPSLCLLYLSTLLPSSLRIRVGQQTGYNPKIRAITSIS